MAGTNSKSTKVDRRAVLKLAAGAGLASATGIGIPPKDLSRIFERRYRGAQSRGLGLGLYLVSRICQRLGWTIQTSSAEGSGTIFRILGIDEA